MHGEGLTFEGPGTTWLGNKEWVNQINSELVKDVQKLRMAGAL